MKDLLQEMGTRLRDGGKLDEWILMADVSNLADGSITLTHIYIYIFIRSYHIFYLPNMFAMILESVS